MMRMKISATSLAALVLAAPMAFAQSPEGGDKSPPSQAQKPSEPMNNAGGSERGMERGAQRNEGAGETGRERAGSAGSERGQTGRGSDDKAERKDTRDAEKADRKDARDAEKADKKEARDADKAQRKESREADKQEKADDKRKSDTERTRSGDSDRPAGEKMRDRDRDERAGTGDQKRDQQTGDKDGAKDKDRDQAGDQAKDKDRDQARGEIREEDRQKAERVRAKVDQSERQRVREVAFRDNVHRARDVNVRIDIGVRLPRTVTLYELPPDVVEIVPVYRGYRYVVVDDAYCIVEPDTYLIVDVIYRSGDRGEYAYRSGGGARLELTNDQIELIRREVRDRGRKFDYDGDLEVGIRLPGDIAFEEFPEVIVERVPVVREYRFAIVEDEIAIVSPDERSVVYVIEN